MLKFEDPVVVQRLACRVSRDFRIDSLVTAMTSRVDDRRAQVHFRSSPQIDCSLNKAYGRRRCDNDHIDGIPMGHAGGCHRCHHGSGLWRVRANCTRSFTIRPSRQGLIPVRPHALYNGLRLASAASCSQPRSRACCRALAVSCSAAYFLVHSSHSLLSISMNNFCIQQRLGQAHMQTQRAHSFPQAHSIPRVNATGVERGGVCLHVKRQPMDSAIPVLVRVELQRHRTVKPRYGRWNVSPRGPRIRFSPHPGACVAGVRLVPVPVQMWKGRAHSVQMWEGCAGSRIPV